MKKPSTKPNVVLVITDDQGYGDLGCHGNPYIQTKHIDKLYNESFRFTNYHVGPTCAPTRAGLMTGHYHNSTGVWHTIGGRSLLRKNEVTLANVFQANGYRTGIFGKWHLGDNYPFRPQDRGFGQTVVHGGGGIGQTSDYWGNDYFDDTYWVNGKEQAFEGYCTDVFFRLGMEFIEQHRDRPFFCYIPTNAPHTPLNVEEKYSSLYKGKVPDNRARFYGMITNIDENVGKLRSKLQELGLEENTIVIFMTDNGTGDGCETEAGTGFVKNGFNAGMRGKKGSPYDGGHRVPFFMHWPGGGLQEGRDVQQLTANVDFMPTLIELCGMAVPETLRFDGKSLAPLLDRAYDSGLWEERSMVTDSQRVPHPVKWKDSAVMTQRWRLINGNELYDMDADPGQTTDAAGLYPEVKMRLMADYERWWEKVSRQFHEDIPIIIGTDHEKVTCLTSHDWRGDIGDCAWNQFEIRLGKPCNGHWEVEFARAGTYSFEVRRWPAEEDRPLAEGIPGEIGWYQGGRAIAIRQATIRIGDIEETKPVDPSDKLIRFTVDLQAGPTHVQTYLTDEEACSIGAYYVYVSRVG